MPKRVSKRERKAIKIAKQVAARLERANEPIPARVIPSAGAIRFDYNNNTFQAYINGKWINAIDIQDNQT